MGNLARKALDKIIIASKTDDLGKLLNVTGTIGWAASAAAFTGAVALNKDIPKEQKKFLIPQEIADGAINCTLFFFGTKYANKWAKSLVRKGGILPKGLDKVEKGAQKRVEGLRAELLNDKTFNEKVFADGSKVSVYDKMIEKVGGEESKIGSHLKNFSTAFTTLVSMAGSAVAMNLITPFVRNDVASRIQHNYMDSAKAQSVKPQQKPIIKPPVKTMSMHQYLVNSRGGMTV